MKPVLSLLIAATSAAFASAAKVESDPSQTLIVYMENATAAPGLARDLAMQLTLRMFSQIGLETRWRLDKPKAVGDGVHRIVVVTLSNRAPADLPAGVLAFSRPFEGIHATIFYDRILATGGPDVAPRLLAHVLVHEITHLLEQTDFHSGSGVMKARWTQGDYNTMERQLLSFTDADIQLIHRGLAQWVTREEFAAVRK